MHKIEQAIQVFLENIESANVPEELIEEFGERCKDALRQCLLAKRSEEPFRIRMSNIGKPLRQLMLEKLYGRPPIDEQARLKLTYGHIYEAMLLFLLKATGLQVETGKQVELDIDGNKIQGTLDLKIDGVIYDVKSASSWSYDNKFTSFDHLRADDPFGYCGQGFGYALADKSHFGGWIVIDKSDGRIKLVNGPDSSYKQVENEYLEDFRQKVKILNTDFKDADMPACTGVLEETFNRKKTGNFYLSKPCEFCPHRYKCHPELTRSEDVNSQAKRKTWKYYTKLLKPVFD